MGTTNKDGSYIKEICPICKALAKVVSIGPSEGKLYCTECHTESDR